MNAKPFPEDVIESYKIDSTVHRLVEAQAFYSEIIHALVHEKLFLQKALAEAQERIPRRIFLENGEVLLYTPPLESYITTDLRNIGKVPSK